MQFMCEKMSNFSTTAKDELSRNGNLTILYSPGPQGGYLERRGSCFLFITLCHPKLVIFLAPFISQFTAKYIITSLQNQFNI